MKFQRPHPGTPRLGRCRPHHHRNGDRHRLEPRIKSGARSAPRARAGAAQRGMPDPIGSPHDPDRRRRLPAVLGATVARAVPVAVAGAGIEPAPGSAGARRGPRHVRKKLRRPGETVRPPRLLTRWRAPKRLAATARAASQRRKRLSVVGNRSGWRFCGPIDNGSFISALAAVHSIRRICRDDAVV